MIRQFRHFGANGWTVQIKLIKALDVAEIVFGSVDFSDNTLTGSSIEAMDFFLCSRFLLSRIIGDGFTNRMVITNSQSSCEIKDFLIGQTGTGIFERDDSRFAFRQSTGFIKGNTLQASAFF